MFKMVLQSPSTRAKVYNKSPESLIHRLVPYMSQLSRASSTSDFTRLVGVRRPVGFGEGTVDGAALVEDEAAHGDGAQGEPEEALLREDADHGGDGGAPPARREIGRAGFFSPSFRLRCVGRRAGGVVGRLRECDAHGPLWCCFLVGRAEVEWSSARDGPAHRANFFLP